MSDFKNKATVKKAKWSTPEIVEIDSDLTDVKNGFNAGSDGSIGSMTSLS